MKYIITIIAFFASIVASAQSMNDYELDTLGGSVVSIRESDLNTATLSDSVRLLMKSLALTNIELRRADSRMSTHAYMTYSAVAIEGLGALCFYAYSRQTPSIAYNSYGEPYVPARDELLRKIGTACCIIGGVVWIASYIPLIGPHITADERGLVVRAKIFGKYPKR